MARNIKVNLVDAHDKFYHIDVTTPPALALSQIAAGLARLTEVMIWREDERRANSDDGAVPEPQRNVHSFRLTDDERDRHWQEVAISDDHGRQFTWRDTPL